jgi:uncharacterized protein YgiB involved in biofilm formation
MLKKLRKSSSRVTLVLIGVAALSGCGKDERRDVYATKEDCLADWGNKPEDCTPATEQKHRSSGFFYGPLYMASMFGGRGGGLGWNSGSGSSRAVGTTSTGSSRSSISSRGGFGSSAHSSAG